MNFKLPRLGLVLLGDRLAVAAVSGRRVEAFSVDAESPAESLRAELDARRVPARSAFLAVARNVVTVKPIELPPVSGDVRQMVGFELERHLPFTAEDASYDFVTLPSDGAGERPAGAEQRVLITAADRRVVDLALRLAEAARLRPLSLTVAAHNLPSLAHIPRNAHVAWVHRAAGSSDLLLLMGDALVLSRSLPGIDDMLVAEELRRSFVAARWRGCDAVWVSGDAADASAGGPLTELGAPLTQPAWTSRAAHQLDSLPEQQRGALQLAVAVAAGRNARPLELLPTTVRPRRLTRAQSFTAGMAAATALLGIIALLAPGWREQQHLNRINAEIERIDPDVKAVDRVVRDLDRKRKLLATVDAVEAAGIRPLPVLRELTEILPNDAWLTTLSLDNKGVELTGAASAASALIPLLENSPRLERVEFSSPVTRGRDNREQFRIRASWEAPSAATGSAAGATSAPGQTPAQRPASTAEAPPAPAVSAPVPAPAPGVTPSAPAVAPSTPGVTPPAPGQPRQAVPQPGARP